MNSFYIPPDPKTFKFSGAFITCNNCKDHRIKYLHIFSSNVFNLDKLNWKRNCYKFWNLTTFVKVISRWLIDTRNIIR